MRQRFAPSGFSAGRPAGAGASPEQFNQVMQRILEQGHWRLRRSALHAAAREGADSDCASLDGLEVRESTWDEWADVAGRA